MNPLVAQLTHRPFPEVAGAVRSHAGQITLAWTEAVREALPDVDGMTFEELRDNVPAILSAIADARASSDPAEIRTLVEQAPMQGLSRFRQQYDVSEVMQEDRLLRAITIEHVEQGLGRQMDRAEAAALNAAIDVMLQQSVVALVNEQQGQLRAAAEAELNYLSFLSHDLNNNLNGVTLMLKMLRQQLSGSGGFSEAVATVDEAHQSIHDTVAGMRRLLDRERLRKPGEAAKAVGPVELHTVASAVARQASPEARRKGLEVAVEVRPDAVAETDRELVRLVLQNLVGNAVKYSHRGTVRIGSELRREGVGSMPGMPGGAGEASRRVVWVSDEGPGITPEHLDNIFEAFRRGEVHGQEGVGLGLAIASQAARLLGAKLTVESEVGVGSTFLLALPPGAADRAG